MIITPGVNYADKYAENVMRNKKKYPKSIILAVERYKKWKKRKDIWFDVDRANEMLDFVQLFIRHVKGPLAGQLMELELWKIFVFANMYDWYHKKEKQSVLFVNHMFKYQKRTERQLSQRVHCSMLCMENLNLEPIVIVQHQTLNKHKTQPNQFAQAIENSEPLARPT
ncbi:hypothetical protein FORC13_p029 (plasmid) [Bacillus cereus]|nr:hypothetical protein FORC13_p029 [Bacillus cereus]